MFFNLIFWILIFISEMKEIISNLLILDQPISSVFQILVFSHYVYRRQI